MSTPGNAATLIPADLPVIDWENCLFLANKKEELAKNILAMFIASLPEHLIIINQSFEQESWKALANELHKLLGSCSYAGAPRLKLVVKEAEKHAREQSSFATIAELVAILNIEAENIVAAYQQFTP